MTKDSLIKASRNFLIAHKNEPGISIYLENKIIERFLIYFVIKKKKKKRNSHRNTYIRVGFSPNRVRIQHDTRERMQSDHVYSPKKKHHTLT